MTARQNGRLALFHPAHQAALAILGWSWLWFGAERAIESARRHRKGFFSFTEGNDASRRGKPGKLSLPTMA